MRRDTLTRARRRRADSVHTRPSGPKNWWQVKETAWGAPLEPSSSEKAATYANAVATFGADAACLGGYCFKYGWKEQARTGSQARALDYTTMLHNFVPL